MEVWIVKPKLLLPSDWGSVFGACGIILTTLSSVKAGTFLRKPVWHFFGNISYSMYLNHIGILYLAIFLLHKYLPILAILPIYVATVVMFSLVTWKTIELPSIAMGRGVSKRFK